MLPAIIKMAGSIFLLKIRQVLFFTYLTFFYYL